jgi:M6 family metalloprotease-like protein
MYRPAATFALASLGLVSAPAVDADRLPAAALATRPLAPVVNVSAEAHGQKIVAAPVAWKTRVDGLTIEHLAGPRRDGHLLVFAWSSAVARWTERDVTTITRRIITGPLTAWETPDGPYTVEHLAGRSLDGSLLVFYRSSRNNLWKVVDVTAKTGRRVADALTSWQTKSGPYNVEHVAGRDSNGNLLVFWWSPAHDWQAVNVSAKTGRLVASPVTSWQLRRNGVNFEYLGGTDTHGNVTIFSWTPSTDWRAAQLLAEHFRGGVSSWLVGARENLAGTRADGSLIVLSRLNTARWKTVNVTALTGERVQGPPTPYRLSTVPFPLPGAVELLASRSRTGHVILHWWKQSLDWQALDLTDITRRSATTAPAAWITTSDSRTVEHLAFNGTDGRLLVVYSFDQPRTLTDAVQAHYESIRWMRNVSRRVLVVLFDTHCGDPRTSPDDVERTAFGPDPSVRGFFRENSGGAFAITEVATLGWYDADQPCAYYLPGSTGHDKMGAALRAADPDFNFAAYDTDHDGTLEPSELGIVFIHPGHAGGLGRFGIKDPTQPNASAGPLVLDGVKIPDGSEMGVGIPPNLGVVAHELSHLLLGLPDMYPCHKHVEGLDDCFFTPTAPSQYSLMDGTYQGTHIDPFNKLKLGWARPRLVFRPGRYTLPDIETRHRVLVLLDPRRGMHECFLVENRYRGTSYDANLADQGLGVWHIMEDSAVYDSAPPPPTVSTTHWGLLGSGNWGRKAIRMVRPVLTESAFQDYLALWDGNDYPLVSADPDPQHSSLRWGNGKPSGFALHHLGMPQADFSLSVGVPPVP